MDRALPDSSAEKNSSSFSYAVDGRFQCFSCGEKGRGAIDLIMKIQRVGFQAAIALLETVTVDDGQRRPRP